MGCHFLRQGIFLTQGSNRGVPHCMQMLYHLSHQQRPMFVYMCGLPRWHGDKEPACQCKRRKRRGFDPCVRKIPWRRKWKPTLVSLPGKFHGQRSLVGYIQSIGSKRVRHDSAHTHTEYVCTTESLCCTSEINMTL